MAEISEESFQEMTEISLLSGEIPSSRDTVDEEARLALSNWDEEQNSAAKSGKFEFGVRSITLNVNQICNLKCVYCAAGGDGTYGSPANQISIEKTLPQLKMLLSELKEGMKFSLTFVGGEPLIHPEAVKAIYEYVTEKCLKVLALPNFTIVTNGTLIDEKTSNILKSMKINILISLDAVKEINDVVRPSKNNESSTDMTLNGLAKLSKDRGEILSIGIASVCSIDNVDLVKNYRFFKTLNPDWLEFNFSYSERSQELNKKYIEQMKLIAEIAWKSGGEAELRKIKDFNHYFKLLDSQQKVENHCGAGKSYFVIDAKNKLYTCPWVVGQKEEVVGDEDSIKIESLKNYSKPLIELNNCQTCWARYLCGGGCMYINKAHSGSKHTKSISFCERTRSLIVLALMYYKLARS
ncbi:MAG: radical SAM protein [Pseudobdellovibrio sp.]